MEVVTIDRAAVNTAVFLRKVDGTQEAALIVYCEQTTVIILRTPGTGYEIGNTVCIFSSSWLHVTRSWSGKADDDFSLRSSKEPVYSFFSIGYCFVKSSGGRIVPKVIDPKLQDIAINVCFAYDLVEARGHNVLVFPTVDPFNLKG